MDKEELLHHRKLKYRYIGGFQEGVPVEPERKRNMKLSEVNKPMTDDIELELENLKKKILESNSATDPISSQAIEKLKQDLDQEITNAFISMGLQEKLESVKLELSKASDDQPNKPPNRHLKEKVDQIMQEFQHNLARPGAYLGLKQKLEKLNMVGKLIELKEKSEKLKTEINQKVPDELKAKMKLLKDAQEKLSKGEAIDKDLVEQTVRAKQELIEFLKSVGLEIVGVTKRNVGPPPPSLQEKITKVNKEIAEEIERVINVAGLGDKVEELKSEIARGSSSEKVEKMQAEIRKEILAALDAMTCKEKLENLRVELASTSGKAEDKVVAENGRL
jgi:acetyl-CoA carboxylase carboxyl transferase subunit alpha